jgi:hypothetical protein
MQLPKKENPAGGRGVPEVSLAAGKIDPEFNPSLRKLQAARLTRRCAITLAMASIVAPLLHGEAAR